jgi:hypothetical protein
MRKFIDKKIAIVALAAMLLQIVISKYIYPIFGTALQNLYSITPTGALTSQTLGNKILGIFSGIIPFSLGNITVWISMFIGAYLLIFVGLLVYDKRWAWKGRTESSRLWAIFLYGSIGLYALLWIAKYIGYSSIDVASFSVSLLIGVAINYVIVAGIYTLAATKIKALNFLRI